MRLLILLFSLCVICIWANGQSLTVDDLLLLSAQSPKNVNKYLANKNFFPGTDNRQYLDGPVTFFEKKKKNNKDSIDRKLELSKKEDNYYYSLFTPDEKEYQSGCNRLREIGFLEYKDASSGNEFFYQKKNITIKAFPSTNGEILNYVFALQKKEMPPVSEISYTEDLLKFTSHEYLVSYFGEENVKKDLYYFSEKELRKCSVLFPNSGQQAVYVWDNEERYSGIDYVLISGILPTIGAAKYSNFIRQSTWLSRDGLYAGMSLNELLQLNGKDFEFYGRNSELAYMVSPERNGTINFKKTGVMLGCVNCSGSKLLSNQKISAIDALQNNLPLFVYYIMITN